MREIQYHNSSNKSLLADLFIHWFYTKKIFTRNIYKITNLTGSISITTQMLMAILALYLKKKSK